MAKYVWVYVFTHRSSSLDQLLRDPKLAGIPDISNPSGTPLQAGPVPENLDSQTKKEAPDHYIWVAPPHPEFADAQSYVLSGGGKDLVEQPEYRGRSLFKIE